MSKVQILSKQATPEASVVPVFAPLEFTPHWLDSIRVNYSAAERRIKTLAGRRSVKKEQQLAWMLRAISCIDLTTLQGDDTEGRVRRLANKALNPLRQDLVKQANCEQLNLTTGAVCVYHSMIPAALEVLKNRVPIAAVSAGFPTGLAPMSIKLQEIEASVAAGAAEIDIVVTRSHVLTHSWQALYDEVKAYKLACGNARMKTIIATGQLGNLKNVAKASMVAMMAGSDFIKTSTGTESVNATLLVSLIMMRTIREFYQLTGRKVAFKPAGGIRTAKDAVNYLVLVKEELGDEWLNANMFRFGASGLLTDLERQIEFHLTGRYSANYRHAMA